MRLVKIECTESTKSAIAALPDDYTEDQAIDWLHSWAEPQEITFDGDVYVAMDVPMPEGFPLEFGCFWFSECDPTPDDIA